MAAKLLLLILAAGATAASLLVLRHERIDTAYEISRTHRQAMERRRTLWSLRWTIAERCRPEEVERMMMGLGGQWNAIARKALVDSGTATGAHTDAPAPPAGERRLVIAAPGVSRE